ncbi:MAG TPA: zinc-ribbon domain-containing protein, partial [Anaerolineaceae bacterium]|nr:zinc-ribbon domain-containing protein [Anaerolineaceae bacterium]
MKNNQPDMPGNKSRNCPVCGTKLSENARRCLVCGTDLSDSIAAPKSKSKTERIDSKRIPEVKINLIALIAIIVLILVLI